MKKIFAAVVVVSLIFVFANTLFAKQQNSFEKGEVGYFQFPAFQDENDFVIWPNSTLKGLSGIMGKITKKTVIKIANRKISRENLDLLTGKKVFVYGRFRQVGEGEGSYYHTDSLVIYILFEGESRGR